MIIPDVAIKRYRGRSGKGPRPDDLSPAVAIGDEPVVITLDPLEMREGFIEIIALEERRRVVTVIELLSPANKAAGSAGRREYLKKQREVLESRANLLEIDLLKRGATYRPGPRREGRRSGSF